MSSVKSTPGAKQPGAKASDTSIDILIIIDTDRLKQAFPNGGSKDSNNPTPIDHSYEFMYCTGAPSQNAGSGNLSFTANVGDFVSFFGTSIYANSDDAVIVYGIVPINGQPNLFNPFQVDLITRNQAVEPNPNTQNGIPAQTTQITFSSLTSRVKQGGQSEGYWVQFGLYTLVNGETQQLYGYFAWDPTIIVN
ncbi:MAG TPA: inclusion body family protein [Chitinophaga sp.]